MKHRGKGHQGYLWIWVSVNSGGSDDDWLSTNVKCLSASPAVCMASFKCIRVYCSLSLIGDWNNQKAEIPSFLSSVSVIGIQKTNGEFTGWGWDCVALLPVKRWPLSRCYFRKFPIHFGSLELDQKWGCTPFSYITQLLLCLSWNSWRVV